MPRILSEIARKLSRLFLGCIVVRTFDDLRRTVPTCVFTHTRTLSVVPMRPEPRVNAALFVKWRHTRTVKAGSLLGANLAETLKVRRVPLDVFEKSGKSAQKGHSAVRQYKLTIKRRAEAKRGLGRIKRFPITRRNRLNFLKTPPKFEKATLLALYSPIFQEKVVRSALDKTSGNLLFWYDNDRVKLGDRYHLLLLRVFGGEVPLKWVWVPANKNLG
jgi:hypothetical protein